MLTDPEMSCSKCGELVTDFIHCEGCGQDLHYECAGIKETLYRKKNKEARLAWRCVGCKPIRSCPTTPTTEETGSTSAGDLNAATLKHILEKLGKLDELDSISGQVRDLNKSIGFMSDQYDKLFAELTNYKKMCSDNTKEILQLKNENQYLNRQMKKIQVDMRRLEQNALDDSIEIYGVVPKDNENVKEIVMKIGQELRLPCAENVIVHVSRRQVPKFAKKTGNNARPPAIVVQFTSKLIREKWVEKKRTGLNSINIVGGASGENIYINENLCPAVKELFWNARVSAKKCNIKYVWVKNGAVFMRKNDGEPVKTIQGLDDLPRLPGDTMIVKEASLTGVTGDDLE